MAENSPVPAVAPTRPLAPDTIPVPAVSAAPLLCAWQKWLPIDPTESSFRIRHGGDPVSHALEILEELCLEWRR